MKVYTKTGDSGKTSLYTGERVEKGCARIESLGLLDEFQATLGVARAHASRGSVKRVLEKVETDLIAMMVEVASSSFEPRITASRVSEIESLIDSFSEEAGVEFEWMIPGKTVGEAHLNLARTVCRRAERYLHAHAEEVAPNQQTMIYLNRTSDLLYVLARLEAKEFSVRQC